MISAGDQRAFSIAYDRHYQALVRYCRGILLSHEDAEDAAQSAMLAALRTLPDKPAAVNLRAWLYRVAHNEAIDLLRARRPHDSLDSAEEFTSPASADAAEVADTRARLNQLVRDLRSLPERQRGALVMREFCGLGYEEIADAIGGSEAAAMQTVFEARSALVTYEEGRSLNCDGIQRIIADGDRRSMRARRVRAHMRSCDGCKTFETSITRRRRDYALLVPLALGAKGGLLALLGLTRSSARDVAIRCAAVIGRNQSAPAGMRGAAVGVLCAAAGGGVVGIAHIAAVSHSHAHTRPVSLTQGVAPSARAHRVVRTRATATRHSAWRRPRSARHDARIHHTRLPATPRPFAAAPISVAGAAVRPAAQPVAPSPAAAQPSRRAAPVSAAVSVGPGHAGVHVAATVGGATPVASVTGDVSVSTSGGGAGVGASVAATTPIASAGVAVSGSAQSTSSGASAGANVDASLCLLSCQ